MFICPDCGLDITATKVEQVFYYLGNEIFRLPHYYCADDKASYAPYNGGREYLKQTPILAWPLAFSMDRLGV